MTGTLTNYTVANNGFTQFRETGKLQTMHRRRCCKVRANVGGRHRGRGGYCLP